MKREAELRRKLRTYRSLDEVVGAMKSLSAAHFRSTRDALEPLRNYVRAVEAIHAGVSRHPSARSGPAGILVIGGDFGLAGAYHTRLADVATERRRRIGSGPTWVVGRRTASLLERRGVTVDETFEAATSMPAVPTLLFQLVERVAEQYAHVPLASVDTVSARFEGIGSFSAMAHALLPLDSGAVDAELPKPRYASADSLEAAATRELLYVRLYERLVDALASEHGARLTATQAAERFLDERRADAERRLRVAARESGTQEMLEVVVGLRARRR